MTSSEGQVELHGPSDEQSVTVDGWSVPFLTASPMNGGKVDLSLDQRYGLILTVEEFERFVPFLADAIAIALGYTCHPRADWDAPKRRYPMHRIHTILSTEGEPDGDRTSSP